MAEQNPSTGTSTGFYIGLAALGVIGALGLFMVIYAIGTTFRDRFVSGTPTAAQPTQVAGVATNLPVQPTQPQQPGQPTAAQPTQIAPTQPPAAQPSATPAGLRMKVVNAGFFRSGPGLEYEVLGSMANGENYPIVGRTNEGAWLAVQYTTTRVVWVYITLVQVEGGTLADAPVLATPRPPATATPIPPTPIPATLPPVFTATPNVPVGGTVRGIRADYFRLRSASVGVNGEIWFDFKVTNTSGDSVSYNGLGPVVVGVKSKPSWGDSVFGPNQTLEWSDHFEISSGGKFTVYLGICFKGSRAACESSNDIGSWSLLSPGVSIEVK